MTGGVLSGGVWPKMRREPVTVEVRREEYGTRIDLRTRRSWKKLSVEERAKVLRIGAEALREYAQQMVNEAEELATGDGVTG